MPKRTIDDRISEYHEKIKKLQEQKSKEPLRKRVRILYSSSDEDFNQDSENEIVNSPQHGTNSEMGQEADEIELGSQEDPIDPSQGPLRNNASEANQHIEPVITIIEPQPSTSKEAESAKAPLDPELLLALGESTDDTPEFGKAIHENLANLWLPLLKKGLSKESREKLLKNNLIPENCKLLQSPKLNPEISAAVSDVVRGRDKKLLSFQQQLGAGITAINKGMEILLNSDNKAQALTHLSDSCRILTDLHYSSTKDRIKLITPSLEKNILHVIQDSKRDDTLFGNTLSEKIKAGKAIARQGQQIKKTMTNQALTATPRQSTTNRYNQQGNWRGPPRYQASRGGRGSQSKPSHVHQHSNNPGIITPFTPALPWVPRGFAGGSHPSWNTTRGSALNAGFTIK